MTNNLAIVFPGQGSQKVGMLQELAEQSGQVVNTFAQASSVLGFDLWDISQNGPEEKLNQTDITQPALLAAGVAMWRVWQERGENLAPIFLAGHSLGEYTALVCANAIEFTDAIKLVQDRGRFMQDAYSGESAMVAIIGLDKDTVHRVCHEAAGDEILIPANYNSPGQIVLAGQLEAAKRSIDLAKAAGAKIAKIIPVSVPSHCELMKPAAQRLAARLAEINIKAPSIPVIHNVDVKSYQDANAIRDALVRQLYSPVRWDETIQFMFDHGAVNIVECGPGKVLTNLMKKR